MSIVEAPRFIPMTPRYRLNAPVMIETPSEEAQSDIIDGWDSFFEGDEPMRGEHMGFLVRDIIEISGGIKDPDGISELILIEPGGGALQVMFQHRPNDLIPGGDTNITITSKQAHGTTTEKIVWGTDFNTGREIFMRDKTTREKTPALSTIHYIDGGKYTSFATLQSAEQQVTPMGVASEPPRAYSMQTDGRDLLQKAYGFAKYNRVRNMATTQLQVI